MKVFIIVLIFVIAANGQMPDLPLDLLNSMRKAMTVCAKKTGANPLDIGRIIGTEIPEGKRACLMACVMKETKGMNADNSMNLEKMKETMSPIKDKSPEKFEKITQVMEMCKKEEKPDTDECNAAKTFKTCMISKAKEVGLEQ